MSGCARAPAPRCVGGVADISQQQHRQSSGSHDFDFGVGDYESGIVTLRKHYALKDEARTRRRRR